MKLNKILMIFHENIMGNMGFKKHTAPIIHLKIKSKNIYSEKNTHYTSILDYSVTMKYYYFD